MKTTMLQNRLFAAAVLATLAGVVFLIFQPYFSNADVRSQSSGARLSSDQQEGVIAQVEGIFTTSVRHVFDRDYWIANMHNIRNPGF
jgi:hypothetical protein